MQEASERMMNIFFEIHRRYPTPQEAEEFLEQVCIIHSWGGAAHPARSTEVEKLLDQPVEEVSVDEVYAQFQEKIKGIRLDSMIQTSAHFWRAGGNYYSDNLNTINRID